MDIQVDGGINEQTLTTVLDAGANLVVAGSYVFKGDLEENAKSVRKVLDQYEN